MRIPLAVYGRREVCLFGGGLLLATVLSAVFFWYLAPLSLILFGWVLYFFRDPERVAPDAPKLLVAPADGHVTELADCESGELGGPAKRLSIFLSVFDVHINRAPCAGRVLSVTYQAGKFVNAMRADSGTLNESNAVLLECNETPGLKLLVRQVAGLIARRIVCVAEAGTALARGERFGMIKFGSRTDLVVPAAALAEWKVKPGDAVRAGRTIVGTLK